MRAGHIEYVKLCIYDIKPYMTKVTMNKAVYSHVDYDI